MIAPGRARRPGIGVPRIEDETAAELDACPFCEGREDRTPPELLQVGRSRDEPVDTPGWLVRVVPNLYPAFIEQYVVVHTPDHLRTFADLPDVQVSLVGDAWSDVFASARARGHEHVFGFINEGRLAGASLAHTHSQVAVLDTPPPAASTEAQEAVAALVANAEQRIAENEDCVAAVHPAGRAPYETLIAPRVRRALGPDDEELLTSALLLLRDVVRRLRTLEGPVPWNAWLHAGEHWHLELVPRLTVFAGIELGAGIWVNTLAPEEAARALRDAKL